jgi:TOBE domain
VKECAFLGHAFRARVGLADGLELVAYAPAPLAPGRTVWLRAREVAVVP